MTTTRRSFFKASAAAAALVAAPRPLLARLGARPEPAPLIDDPRLKNLCARALEAARAAGADYADVRLSHDWLRDFTTSSVGDLEMLNVNVRALANGYWGFASGRVWDADAMPRLAQTAVYQAKTNALGKPRAVELAPTPIVRDGHWVMPVTIDPFEVAVLEVIDLLGGLQLYAQQKPRLRVTRNGCQAIKQETAFASTSGSYCTQRTYRMSGAFQYVYAYKDRGVTSGLDCLTPAGVGWELYRDQPLREELRRSIAEAEVDLSLPPMPIDVGRYDTVFDALSMAQLLDQTLGRATELDRALGYEANAGGTSYIAEPLEMLGTYQAGSPLATVRADRSAPGGAATVKWDDEGVAPDDFHLVKDGVLVDFQTTRESAGWLKEAYAKRGQPFRSHGCAKASSASFAPLQRTPNLTLAPGREEHDFDALVAGVVDGIAFKRMILDMDFQSSSGLGGGSAFKIKKGKRVGVLPGAGILFRATDLWKALAALGGAASARRYGFQTAKGEPTQPHFASVTAVPAMARQVTLIDVMRKA